MAATFLLNKALSTSTVPPFLYLLTCFLMFSASLDVKGLIVQSIGFPFSSKNAVLAGNLIVSLSFFFCLKNDYNAMILSTFLVKRSLCLHCFIIVLY